MKTEWQIRFARLQSLDQRLLYGLMIGASILSFFVTVRLRSPLGPEARGIYEAIESCPEDRVILIDSSWDQGSQAENWPQLEAVCEHCMQRGARFVLVSVGVTPLGPELAQQVCERLGRKYGRIYGRDWVNLGYIPAGATGMGFLIDALAKDLHTLFPQDLHHTPVARLPLMQRVHDIRDVHLVYCVTYAPSTDWVSFVRGQYGTPIAFGCMSIMGPYYYPLLDSSQLVGMLVGLRGAAEYEGAIRSAGKGSQLMVPQAFAHLLIITFVLLGNVGYLATRKSRMGAS